MTPYDIEQLTGLVDVIVSDDTGSLTLAAEGSQAAVERAQAALLAVGIHATPEEFADAFAATDPAAVPKSVSARQIRLWLVSHGIGLAMVEAAIDGIPDQQQRDMVRVEWEYAPYVERTHAMLVPLAAALGLSEAQVDAAFREAASL